MKIKLIMLALFVGMLASCAGKGDKEGSANQSSENAVEEVAAVSENASYDIPGIMALTTKGDLGESDQDFVIDQYEIFARVTKGMDEKAKMEYLKGLGDEGKVVMLVVMGVENTNDFTDAQKSRIEKINKENK